MPKEISKAFEEMEKELFENMMKKVLSDLPKEDAKNFNWKNWEAEMLKKIGDYKKENIKILEKYKINKTDIMDNLVNNFIKGKKYQIQDIKKAYKKGFRKNQSEKKRKEDLKKLNNDLNAGLSFNKINNKKLNSLIEMTNKDIQRTQNSMINSTNNIYRNCVLSAQMYANVTGDTWAAVDLASKKFLENGIGSVVYKNGRKMNSASYSEMAIRTANKKAYMIGEADTRDEWGIHTVIVFGSNTGCPLCQPYQNEVFIDDEYGEGTPEEADKTGYPLLSDAIADGLFHPNCRDVTSTYYEGITKIPKMSEEDREMQIENYNLEQRQRYNERQIRKYKRLRDGSLNEDNKERYNNKVKRWQGIQRNHINENSNVLRRNYNREKVRN